MSDNAISLIKIFACACSPEGPAVLSSVLYLLRIGGACEIRLRNPLFPCLGAGGSSADDSESSRKVTLFLLSEGHIPLGCAISVVTGLVLSLVTSASGGLPRRAKSLSDIVSPSVLVVDRFGVIGLFLEPGDLPFTLEVACLAFDFVVNFADDDVGNTTASFSIVFLDRASALTFNLPGLWINLYSYSRESGPPTT